MYQTWQRWYHGVSYQTIRYRKSPKCHPFLHYCLVPFVGKLHINDHHAWNIAHPSLLANIWSISYLMFTIFCPLGTVIFLSMLADIVMWMLSCPIPCVLHHYILCIVIFWQVDNKMKDDGWGWTSSLIFAVGNPIVWVYF